MKTTALIAALSLGTAATASNTFGFQATVEDDSSIMIDLVNTSAAGTLAVYDYSTGEFGMLLGTVPLSAGANTDVTVPLDANSANEVAAVIYEGDVTSPSMAAGWVQLRVTED
jgi:hypothetical protein